MMGRPWDTPPPAHQSPGLVSKCAVHPSGQTQQLPTKIGKEREGCSRTRPLKAKPCQVPDVTTTDSKPDLHHGCIPVGIAVARPRVQPYGPTIGLTDDRSCQPLSCIPGQQIAAPTAGGCGQPIPACGQQVTPCGQQISPCGQQLPTSWIPPHHWHHPPYPGIEGCGVPPVGFQLHRDPMTGQLLLLPNPVEGRAVVWGGPPPLQVMAPPQPLLLDRFVTLAPQPDNRRRDQPLSGMMVGCEFPKSGREVQQQQQQQQQQQVVIQQVGGGNPSQQLVLSSQLVEQSLGTSVVISNQLSENTVTLSPQLVDSFPQPGIIHPGLVITETNSFLRSDINTLYPMNGNVVIKEELKPDITETKDISSPPEEDKEEVMNKVQDASNQTETPSVSDEDSNSMKEGILIKQEVKDEETEQPDLSGLELLSNSIVQYECSREGSAPNPPPPPPIDESSLEKQEEKIVEEEGMLGGLGLLCQLAHLRFIEETQNENNLPNGNNPIEVKVKEEKTEKLVPNLMSEEKTSSLTKPSKEKLLKTPTKSPVLKKKPGRPRKSPIRCDPPILEAWSEPAVRRPNSPLTPPMLSPHKNQHIHSEDECTSSKKRKVGRPRKRDETPDQTETIVAKNSLPSKTIVGLLLANQVSQHKIKPKLKAEAKVKSWEDDDEELSPGKLDPPLALPKIEDPKRNKIKSIIKKPLFPTKAAKKDVETFTETKQPPLLVPDSETKQKQASTPELKIKEHKHLASNSDLKIKEHKQPASNSELKIKEHKQPASTTELKIKEHKQPASTAELKIKEHKQLTSTPELKIKEHKQSASTPELKIKEHKQLSSTPELKIKDHKQLASTPELKIKDHKQLASTLELKIKEHKQLASTSELKIKEQKPTPSTPELKTKVDQRKTPTCEAKPDLETKKNSDKHITSESAKVKEKKKQSLPDPKVQPEPCQLTVKQEKELKISSPEPKLKVVQELSVIKQKVETTQEIPLKSVTQTPKLAPNPIVLDSKTPQKNVKLAEEPTLKKLNKNSVQDCTLNEEHLTCLPRRVLFSEDGLLYAGQLSEVTPPDLYSVTLDKERGHKPHILATEQILTETMLEMSCEGMHLPVGTRLCAYWSQQYRCLYPGTVYEEAKPDDAFISVEFDDGDNGTISRSDVRLLPPNYPIVDCDPTSLHGISHRKRHNSSASNDSHSTKSEPKESLSPPEPSKPKEEEKENIIVDKKKKCDPSTKIESEEERRRIKKKKKMELKKLLANDSVWQDLMKYKRKHRQLCKMRHKHKHKHKRHKHKHSKSLVDEQENQIDVQIQEPHSRIMTDSHVPAPSEGCPTLPAEPSPIPPKQPAPPSKAEACAAPVKTQTESKPKAEAEKRKDVKPVEKEDEPSPPKKAKGKKERQNSVESKSKMAAFLPTRQLWTWHGKGFKRGKGPSPKARKKIFYKSIKRCNEIISVGDCAVFLSTGRADRPYIGRIEAMWECWGSTMLVRVSWFYHPEETCATSNQLPFPGGLFESQHIDENDIQTISHKCDVLSIAEFKKKISECPSLVKSVYENNDTYYLAGSYDPTHSTLTVLPELKQYIST